MVSRQARQWMKTGSGINKYKAVNHRNKYFVIVSWRLYSEAQMKKPTPSYNPQKVAGLCNAVLCMNAMEAHTSSSPLLASLLCVCVSLVKQAHTLAAHDTESTGEQRDSYVIGSRFSECQHCCYWLGYTHLQQTPRLQQNKKITGNYRQNAGFPQIITWPQTSLESQVMIKKGYFSMSLYTVWVHTWFI